MVKWTYELFKKEVEKNEGYKLISTEYKGCHSKVKILHEICNTEYEVSPTNFLSGRRCRKCALLKHNREIALKEKHNRTPESFKEEVKSLVGEEYTFLENFINTETLINVKHNSCGNIYKVRPYNFLNGKRCPKCAKKIANEKHKIGIKETKKRVEEVLGNDYEVILNQPYINNNTKIKVLHKKCNKIFEATPINLLNGKGCSYCNKSTKYTNETYQEALGNSYTVLSEYINNKHSITVKHNKCGYVWTARALDILHPYSRNGKIIERCPRCNKTLGYSSGEKEIYKYLKEELNINNIIENDRKILNGKELDIYMPNLNLAIEFDGLYWHSDEFLDKEYHLNKTNECKKKNIRLIHLMEDEWINKKELIKYKLKYLTNTLNKNIYANKCYIEKINNDIKNQFLEENDIEGIDSSQIKLGLWYPNNTGDILMAVMTFYKTKNNYEYMLSKYTIEKEFNVIDGFNTLLNYFKNNYNWNKILFSIDLRWMEEKDFINNGFIIDGYTKPKYYYINKNHTKRYKQNEIKDTENLFKIYDCGKAVMHLINKK